MIMLRILLSVAAILILAAPAAAKERSFVLGGFERIVVEGDIVVDIATDASPKAVATGTQDQLDRVQLNRSGNTLTARLLSPVRTGQDRSANGGPLVVHLATRRLSQIVLKGNGEVTAGALDDRSVRVLLTGNGHITIDKVEADQLYVSVAGAGTVTINGGAAREGQVQLNGPANWQASGLTLDRLDLNHSGPGDQRGRSRGIHAHFQQRHRRYRDLGRRRLRHPLDRIGADHLRRRQGFAPAPERAGDALGPIQSGNSFKLSQIELGQFEFAESI